VAIGAPNHDFDSFDTAGHVQVFEWKEDSWVQRGQDIDSCYAVSLAGDGNIVAVGSSGLHARVLKWDGSTWSQMGDHLAEGAHVESSSKVSLSDDGREVIVGGGEWGDHSRLFFWDGSKWKLRKAFDAIPDSSVSHAGVVGTVAIGESAYKRSEWHYNAGHVQVYSCDMQ
jgi:hypothetical protein